VRRPGALIRSLVAAGILGAPAVCLAQEGGIEVGRPAPPVVVNDLDGKPVHLADLFGTKPVVLEWWATWCGLCEELLPRMRAAHQRYGDQVAFLGINVTVNQSTARVRRYLETHRPPFRTLYDTEGASVRAYQVPTTSFVVVVDGAGRVAYTGSGGEQDIVAALAPLVARPAARPTSTRPPSDADQPP
jgi:thiol-disulfide isomerase/thioredoxin